MADTFLNNLGKQTSSDKNQTVTDPFINNMSRVTLNDFYIPLRNLRNTVGSTTPIDSPPGYLVATIGVYYAGSLRYNIPILFPESMSENLSSSFVKESPVGSTYPHAAFANTQPQTVSISFIASSDYLPKQYGTMKDYINTIKQMVKPEYSGNLVLPPEVYVHVSDIEFTGVCDSISVEYKNIFTSTGRMVMATINCGFTVTG